MKKRFTRWKALYHVVPSPCPTHDGPRVSAPFVFACQCRKDHLSKLPSPWLWQKAGENWGKVGWQTRPEGGGQHHLVMLPLRSPPGHTGAAGLMDAALVLPNRACLVLLLSSPGLAGSRHLGLVGTPPCCHWPRGALQKIGRRGDVADLREKKSKGGFVSRT